MKVRQIMTRNVATCPSAASAAQAARLMWDRDCGIVPITDPTTGAVCGVVTDRDACMASLTQGQPLEKIPVTAFMSRHVHHCRADQDVKIVHGLMRKHQIRRLPVLDRASKPVGIVSLNDLARAIQGSQGQDARLQLKEVAETLRAISMRPAQKEAEA